MKTKLILLTTAVAAAIVGGVFLFSGFKKTSPKDLAGAKQFMAVLCRQITNDSDSVKYYFDMPKKQADVDSLVKMLAMPNWIEKDFWPWFYLKPEAPGPVKQISNTSFEVDLLATLSRDSLPKKTLTITLTITKNKDGQFKITGFNFDNFREKYAAYRELVYKERQSDKAIYTPATLTAFKNAKVLDARGDSVLLFQHEEGQTYYFIKRGKGRPPYLTEYEVKPIPPAKIGMANTALKVIIPVSYDMVHNVGATFPGLIEVENNNKRGFYDIAGKNVLPVVYDEVFPLNDKDNKAVLRKGDAYYWWKTNGTISAPDVGIKIAELLPQIQAFGQSIKLDKDNLRHGAEYNSRIKHNSVYFPPSYLVDWHIRRPMERFGNPQRKFVYPMGGTSLSDIKYNGEHEKQNWLVAFFYSVTQHYIDGREGFYGTKAVVMANKKRNRIYSQQLEMAANDDWYGGHLSGNCDIYTTRAINDTLYEIKYGSAMSIELYNGELVTAGPKYAYLVLRNDKLVEKATRRRFAFSQYVRMDESYISGCYQLGHEKDKKTIDALSAEMLQYLKNEIYADCGHPLKNERWRNLLSWFDEDADGNKTKQVALSPIDQYNIAFINQKLKELNSTKLLAAK